VSPKQDEKEQHPRSKAQIQSDMAETRERLVTNINRLKTETAPPVIRAKVKAKVAGVFIDLQTGEVRIERVIAVAVGVLSLVAVRRGFKVRGRRRELGRLREVVWVPVPRSVVSPEVARVAREAAELAPGPAMSMVTSASLEAGQIPLAVTAS
jgi:hypothetical protein